MNTIFKVFKIFVSNIFSFGNFWEGFKKGPKGIIKNIAIILLALYGYGAISFSYGATSYMLYQDFSAKGLGYLMPLSSIIMAVFVTLGFGFASVATNYYTGNGEEFFMAMPLRPVDIFGAKFGVSFVTDAGFGALMILISSVIYGKAEGLLLNPLFYLGALFTICSIAVFSVLLIYFLLIFVLTICPKLRQKSFLSGIAGVFILIFALAYGLMIGGVQPGIEDFNANFQIRMISNMVTTLAGAVPFILYFAKALDGNILSILIEVAVVAILVFVLIPLLAPLYIKTLNGFSDVKTKKISGQKVEKVLQSETKSRSIFKALYFRDVKTIFREPAFFANGPFILILMPVILIFSFGMGFFMASQNGSLGDMQSDLTAMISDLIVTPEMLEKVKFFIILAAGGFAAFLGNATNIAITSFSREGKALYDLKAMPIEIETMVFVKFFHALTYCFAGGVIIDIFLILINAFLGNIFDYAFMINVSFLVVVLAVAISIFLIFVDMFIDSVNPKLQWENPTAAFKQNVNTLFAIFIELGVIGIFVVLGVYVMPKNETGIMILCGISIVLGAPLGSWYWKYMNKKFPVM